MTRTEFYNDLFKRAALVVSEYCRKGKNEVEQESLMKALRKLRKGEFDIKADEAFDICLALGEIPKDSGLNILHKTVTFIFGMKIDSEQSEIEVQREYGSF